MNPSQMSRAEAEAEIRRIWNFRSWSTADLRRISNCEAQIRELDAENPMTRPLRIEEPVRLMREQLASLTGAR